jgi:hypothetical protein
MMNTSTRMNNTRGTGSYSYTVSPRAVQANRPKYREPSATPPQNDALYVHSIILHTIST